MSAKHIDSIKRKISSLDINELDEIKNYIQSLEEERYDDPEYFKYHTKIDNYLYRVYYDDGSHWSCCIGKDAFDQYMKDPRAIKIERYTKELFPVFELLLRK